MDKKTSIKTTSKGASEYTSGPLGGMPPKKSVEEIAKVNSPDARKAAPDSFRPKG